MSYITKLQFGIYTVACLLLVKIKGVCTKGTSFFLGLPHINNNGTISIGSSCMFISKETGNAIGLAHRCMLTTQHKSSKLSIGKNCGFSGASVWCFNSIQIGNNVKVGANCLIMDGDAHQDDPRAGIDKPIVIEDNVWLGANVTVMKGVTIGKNTLIGINSVVTSDIPQNVIAAGNPCRVIKTLTEAQILKLENV